jgi:hypothetical protein
VVVVGWDGRRPVHATLAHVDVIDGKLWTQHDQTEQGVAPDLVAAGVPGIGSCSRSNRPHVHIEACIHGQTVDPRPAATVEPVGRAPRAECLKATTRR